MFTIDFTKPFLYKDVIYFNQGNLATNNILRCKLVTGGDITLEGYMATVAFKTLSHPEINASATIVDKANCVIDIKFPSNALEVGINELEIILSKGEGIDKVVTPSPVIKYEVWQCITTGNGIQGDNNYPILIDLITDVNNAAAIANNAIDKANTSLNKANKMISDTNNVIVKANEVIDNTNNAKDKALEVIDEVEKTIAAGTQDLEVKRAREDSFGVTHDSLFQRLESDLKIDEKPLKQEVLDLAGLKEVQEMTYDSSTVPNYNGSMVCEETKNGTVKVLKIKGKSLVNIFKISRSDKNDIKLFYECDRNIGTSFKDTNVTLFNPTGKKVIFDIRSSNTGNWLRSVVMSANELSKHITLTEDEYIGYIYGQVVDGWVSSNEELQKLKGCCVVVTGDHTQNPPREYFEGISSVGTGVDKIEVSSCGKNLLDISKPIIDPKNTYGYFKLPKTNNKVSISLIDKDSSLSIDKVYLGLTKTGIDSGNGNEISWIVANGQLVNSYPKDYSYVSFFPNNKETLDLILRRFDIMVNLGDVTIPYEPYKEDKKNSFIQR